MSRSPGAAPGVGLRPTRAADLDFVLALEQDAENAPFIGSWSRETHGAAIASPDRGHWIVEQDGRPAGYLIAYDLRGSGRGVYVKRIAVREKSRGLGRAALRGFAEHAFGELAAPFVWLAVSPGNGRARRAYQGVGFELLEVGGAERDAWSRAVGGFSEASSVMILLREPRDPATATAAWYRPGARREGGPMPPSDEHERPGDERPGVWVGHVTLPTSDVPATREFMVRIGMRPIAQGDDFAVLELRGGTHLVVFASPEPASGAAYFDLMVDDLEATHARLRAQGLSPSEIEPGRIHRSFTVSAPSGHTLKFNSSHVSDRPV